MLQIKRLYIFIIFAATLLSAVPVSVSAQLLEGGGTKDQINKQLQRVVNDVGGNPRDPRAYAFYLIAVFVSIMSTVLMIQVMIGGYWYITARGDETKIENAQASIRRAIIGLIVVLSSYAIVRLVTRTVGGTVNQGADYYQNRQELNPYGAGDTTQ